MDLTLQIYSIGSGKSVEVIEMSHALEMVVLGISVMIAVTMITLTTYLVNLGSGEANRASFEVGQIITLEDADYSDLSGNLSGLYVKELLQKYNDAGVYTLTITENCPDGYYAVTGSDDSGSVKYIKDDDKFTAALYRNESDVIVGITFCQNGMDAVPFDYEEAKSTEDHVENEIIKEQLKIFNQVQDNAGVCSECITSFGNYATLIKEHFNAEMNSEFRRVTGTVADSQAYTVYIEKFKNQTEFYNLLTSCLKAWTAQGAWDMVLEPEIMDEEEYDDYWNDKKEENKDPGSGEETGDEKSGGDAWAAKIDSTTDELGNPAHGLNSGVLGEGEGNAMITNSESEDEKEEPEPLPEPEEKEPASGTEYVPGFEKENDKEEIKNPMEGGN